MEVSNTPVAPKDDHPLTSDCTDGTPSKSSFVTFVIKAVSHGCWNLGALG